MANWVSCKTTQGETILLNFDNAIEIRRDPRVAQTEITFIGGGTQMVADDLPSLKIGGLRT